MILVALHNYSTFIWYIVHSYLAMDVCTAINLVKHVIFFFKVAVLALHNGI